MLCYSWNKLDEKEIVDVGKEDFDEVINLFAKILINGCIRLFKSGLDRNYVEFSEDIPSIKGKLDISSSVKRSSFIKGKVHCIYDEFDHNVLHNQILKSTIRILINIEGIDSELRNQLIEIYRKFKNIELIELNDKIFNKVVLHRNNNFYSFLLNICKIIIENSIVNEESGDFTFIDFIRDERKMATVFEEFVRNFYKKEQNEYKPTVELINWNAIALDGTSLDMLPKMKTDISLESNSKKIIIDTKYYNEALSYYYDKEKIKSINLYQLFAYLKNIETKGGVNTNCDGILLYPTVKKELDEKFKFENHHISISTINLQQPWQNIHNDLLRIIGIDPN